MSSVRFGAFELIVDERVLRRDDEHCVIGARAFDVLVALVERRDRVVSKAELLDIAWDGLVVEDNNLSIQISTLRRVLGQGAISTVPGRGYRFTLSCDAPSRQPALAHPESVAPTRRLTAILAACVAKDDQCSSEAAAVRWSEARGEVIEPHLVAAGGQPLTLSANDCLLTFASAITALRAALDLQHRLALRHTVSDPAPLRMHMAVVVDDASSSDQAPQEKALQRAAAFVARAGAGEVLTDGIVQHLARSDASFHFASIRAQQNPLQDQGSEDAFRASFAVAHAGPLYKPTESTSRYQPRLAVLPFECEDSEVERYFGDGISEEIITHLALNRHLFVIARGSTLHYRNRRERSVDIARELGVRYLLNGSVRRQGQRLRISAEFSDCHLGRVIWADRFEGQHSEIFDLQERIAIRIAGVIDPCVRESELAQVRLRPTENLDAYDCLLRGLHLQYLQDEHAFEQAGAYFRQAVALDARYAQAHSHLAWWLSMCIGEGRAPQSSELRHQAVEHARRAVEIDPRDAWALSIAGHTYSFLHKQFRIALDMFQQALTINPNSAIAWARSGTTLAYLGRGEEAVERVRNALELSPFDQFAFAFCTTYGLASLTCERYDEAVWWLEKARRLNPRYRAAERLLIAAHCLCGQEEQARAMATGFLQMEPDFHVETLASWYPLQSPHLERLMQGLLDAGLPR